MLVTPLGNPLKSLAANAAPTPGLSLLGVQNLSLDLYSLPDDLSPVRFPPCCGVRGSDAKLLLCTQEELSWAGSVYSSGLNLTSAGIL